MPQLDPSIQDFSKNPNEYVLCKKSNLIYAEKKKSGMAAIKATFLNENYSLGAIVEELRKISRLSKDFIVAVNQEIEKHNSAYKEFQKPIELLSLPKKTALKDKVVRVQFNLSEQADSIEKKRHTALSTKKVLKK